MGKISDALDKHRADQDVPTKKISTARSEKIKAHGPYLDYTQQYIAGQNYSAKLLTLLAPQSITAEVFKIIRGTVLYNKNRPAPKAIMITSAIPGEGKSFVASNLSVSFAMGLNENVLLIDIDLRRPSIHKIFGIDNAYGLTEHLQGEKDISEILIRTKIKKLAILPSGKPPPNPVELLSSKKMEAFIKETKNRYQDRFVILDATPSQLTAETNAIANHVDGVILVIMNGKTPRAAVLQTVENIGRQKILGIVFNGSAQSYKAYDRYYSRYYK